MRADITAVIDDQKIVEIGSHEKLMEMRGQYFRMFETWEKQKEERS